MKVLVTGGGGQVATAIAHLRPNQCEAEILPHSELDIRDVGAIERVVGVVQPDVIINTAAYTAVDKAETAVQDAFRVNAEGAGNLARVAGKRRIRLVHISTDFVFDGRNSRPYLPDANPHPENVYGASKLEGEKRIQEELGGQALILRTAWVYASTGRNFVLTMLKLMRMNREVRVVADQVGSPTWAASLAKTLWAATATPDFIGIHHWTDAGVASWYDFAVAISEEAGNLGILPKEVKVTPIVTHDYPVPARRPAYSVLDHKSTEVGLGLKAVHWRTNLRQMLKELSDA